MTSSEIDPRIAALLFEVKKNQLKMVERRGYNIDRERNLLKTKLDDFLHSYITYAKENRRSLRSVLTQIYQNEEGKKIYVYYADASPDSKQLGVKGIEPAIDFMNKEKIHDMIIITAKQLSSSADKKLESLVAYNIQIFTEDEMGFDPTEHFLVPKHIPLTDEQQRSFLNDNGLLIDNIPVILSSDVIARYYGLRAGRIVRIERENMFPTMITKSVSYKQIKD